MLKNYLIIAWKVLLRRKFFTFVSLFGIVFTLLVLMIVSAFLDNTLFPAPSGSRYDRTVVINRIELRGERMHIYSSPSYDFLDKYVRSMQTPELVSVHSRSGETVSYVDGRKLELQLMHTDAAFWEVLELDFLAGQPFSKNEVAGVERVAVITDHTAQQAFGDKSAVGHRLETSDGSYRVVGVIGHKQIPSQECYADVYVPVTLDNFAMTSRRPYSRYTAYAVTPEGVDPGEIKQEFAARMEQVREDYKGEYSLIECEYGTIAELYLSQIIGPDSGLGGPSVAVAAILLLMILFMLFPTINLLNLNISRIMERASEIGIRRAFGASRRTLVGQFLTENLLLTFIGGTIAFILSVIVIMIIDRSGLIPFGTVSLNAKVFLYALALTLFFGVFSGVLPAWRMSRLNPVDALKGGDA